MKKQQHLDQRESNHGKQRQNNMKNKRKTIATAAKQRQNTTKTTTAKHVNYYINWTKEIATAHPAQATDAPAT